MTPGRVAAGQGLGYQLRAYQHPRHRLDRRAHSSCPGQRPAGRRERHVGQHRVRAGLRTARERCASKGRWACARLGRVFRSARSPAAAIPEPSCSHRLLQVKRTFRVARIEPAAEAAARSIDNDGAGQHTPPRTCRAPCETNGTRVARRGSASVTRRSDGRLTARDCAIPGKPHIK